MKRFIFTGTDDHLYHIGNTISYKMAVFSQVLFSPVLHGLFLNEKKFLLMNLDDKVEER
jgi:hypothetical protein